MKKATLQPGFWPWPPGSSEVLVLHPLSVTTAARVLQAHCRRLLARQQKDAAAIFVKGGSKEGGEVPLSASGDSSMTEEEDEDHREMAVLQTARKIDRACSHAQHHVWHVLVKTDLFTR